MALRLEMELGEGVFWDAARESLVWVNILRGEIHELSQGAHRVFSVPTHVGAAAPRLAGGWVLAVREGFAAYDPERNSFESLVRIDVPATRMNDGNVDPRGRFFAGSMLYSEAPGGGCLYRLDPDLSIRVVRDGVHVSNGIDWSPKGDRVYYVDSGTRTVSEFDFDADSGGWSNRRDFATFRGHEGSPDGLTVDQDGCVWLAVWDGSQVRRYTADGRLDAVVSLPVPRVTACGFGGPDLGTLYVTTARVGLVAGALIEHPLSGSMFALRPGVSGFPRRSFLG